MKKGLLVIAVFALLAPFLYLVGCAEQAQNKSLVPTQPTVVCPGAKNIVAMQQQWAKFKTLQFSGNSVTDAEMMKQKTNAFKVLYAAYAEAASCTDFEVASAGRYMLAMLNKEFADSLVQAADPEDLTDTDKREYSARLEDMAFPMKARFIELLKENIAQANLNRTRNKWIDLSLEELRLIEPDVQLQF